MKNRHDNTAPGVLSQPIHEKGTAPIDRPASIRGHATHQQRFPELGTPDDEDHPTDDPATLPKFDAFGFQALEAVVRVLDQSHAIAGQQDDHTACREENSEDDIRV